MNRYVIGIDTGGTFTDGVLMQYRTRKVVSTAKSLTTRGDLKVGVIDVLKQLEVSKEYDVRLVGISSTLATNSVAEGKARKVGLLLIGYDKDLVEGYGLKEEMATEKIAFFQGGHNAQGAEAAPLDEEGIKKWVKENQDDVDALAISSYFSPLNASHEKRVFEIVKEVSDLPVVMGHQLSTKIDSIKRAATASINASLVAVMQDFIEAVRFSLKERGIKAPLMIVRGDGTMMPYTEAVQKPVETVLSGPAASAIGGRFLSTRGNSLVIDVGSTTTDMALVKDSRVVVSEEGARVGDIKTAVEAGRIRTISLGCDSRIFLNKYNKINVGPEKVTSLSQLASRSQKVKKEIKSLKNRSNEPVYFTDIEYWLLYKPLEEEVYNDLQPIQKQVVDLIKDEPHNLTEIFKTCGVYHGSHLQMDDLIKQGYIECASLTPTDLLHVDGQMDIWDHKAARIALDHVKRLPNLTRKKFINKTMNRIVGMLVEEIIIFLACQDMTKNDMPEKIDGEWGRWLLRETLKDENDFVAVNLDSKVPIIGTGAPAEFFLDRAAEFVNAHFLLPKHHEVANAVGAVSGSVMEIREAMVFTQADEENYSYVAKLNGDLKYFEEYDEACEYAESWARREAKQAAVDAGADDPFIEMKDRIEGSLHRYSARAVGNPKLSAQQEN